MLNNFKDFNFKIDVDRLFRYQAPMLPKMITSQQFVVGEVIDGELWLLYASNPPQLAPISDTDVKFQVFVLGEHSDMSSLIDIWHHTCKHHKTQLQIYSLADLGVELI